MDLRREFFRNQLEILYVSSIFLYLQTKDTQISSMFVQISTIREEYIEGNGCFYALFESFYAVFTSFGLGQTEFLLTFVNKK